MGQSYFTSIFTTLYAAIFSFLTVFRYKPEVLLLNGPGTCVPVAVAAFLRYVSYHFCANCHIRSFTLLMAAICRCFYSSTAKSFLWRVSAVSKRCHYLARSCTPSYPSSWSSGRTFSPSTLARPITASCVELLTVLHLYRIQKTCA